MIKRKIILLAMIVAIAACSKKQTERVLLTPNISVMLPDNYKMTKEELYKRTLYSAKSSNNDVILIGKTILRKLDTLSLEEKKKPIVDNLNNYIKPLNGKMLSHTEKIIGDVVQSDFNFEFEKKNTLFTVFGRLILQDSSFLILSYQMKTPVSDYAMKDKNLFFKSILYQ